MRFGLQLSIATGLSLPSSNDCLRSRNQSLQTQLLQEAFLYRNSGKVSDLMLETHMAADYDSSKTTYKHKRHLTMISGAPPMCKILDAKPRAPKPQVLQPKTLAKPRSSRSPFALKATLKGTLKPSPGPNASPARDPGLQDNRHI